MTQLLLWVCLLAVRAAADIYPDCVNGPLSNNAVCNTSASVLERAQGFVSLLTVEEKISLTSSDSPGVSRLGLSPYTWWNEGLVCLFFPDPFNPKHKSK